MERRSALGMRALNAPTANDVRADGKDRPTAVKLDGRWTVDSVEEV